MMLSGRRSGQIQQVARNFDIGEERLQAVVFRTFPKDDEHYLR
jgi:hypothetical protein